MNPLASNEITNIRPDRSAFSLQLRRIANAARTHLYFLLRCRWAVRKGMVRIPWSVELWSPSHDLRLGHRVQFGPHCVVHCDTWIGDSVLFAPRVALIGRNDHRIDVVGKAMWDSPRGNSGRIVIENDVWIGFGAIILSGVHIGRGAVVAAGSVVTADVAPYTVVAGVPASAVKQRFTLDQIAQHEAMLAQQVAREN